MKKIRNILWWLTGSRKKCILLLLCLALLLAALSAVLYYNYLLNLIQRPTKTEISFPTQAETIPEETVPPTTSPLETWPEIVPDKNITNIMLVGQAAREGETALIADSMILCSINRETKTLTMTSLLRDLRLVWPEFRDVYGNPHYGYNRINMAYNMGYKWAGSHQGGMDLLASIVEYNFGVPVDHTIEVNFDMFQKIMEAVGGIDLELSEAEVKYLQDNYPDSETGKGLKPGMNHLSPYLALGYARMRKVGNGDYERTERQRRIITLLIDRMRDKNLLEILELFETVLPFVTTDMTNAEITNYAFAFIPMLKDLNIKSQRIPFDGTYWNVVVEIEGQSVPDQQIDCNAAENGRQLRMSIGMEEPAH